MSLNKRGYEPGDDRSARRAARYSLARGGVWLGDDEALERLGLRHGAVVEVRELTLALQGRHGITGKQVRHPGTVTVREEGKQVEKLRVNSFHLAFSVPKSVSALLAVADKDLREALEAAVLEATHVAVGHITSTRATVGGKSQGNGFVAAFSLDRVARRARDEEVPSPQLHVHVDLVGVLDASGRLRTPNSEALYKEGAMLEAGAVGRAVLARRLEELGFTIRARTGSRGRYFEIDGVPEELCESFSGRSRDVAAWRAANGPMTNVEAARGALLTRGGKDGFTDEELEAAWAQEAQRLGFGPEQLAALREGRGTAHDVAALQEHVRKEILERLWQDGPAISIGHLRALAYEMAPLGLTVDQATAVVAGMQQRGELVALDEWKVTSREIRDAEQDVRNIAVQAARGGGPGLSEAAISHGIAQAERALGGHRLDKDEQVPAVRALTQGAGWACLTGRAGTGKSPVLAAVADAHRYDGWNVVATAVDGATTQRLGKDVQAPGVTIRQLMRRYADGKLRINGKTLIIIEEASKVGLRDWRDIAKVCAETGARIMPVGDPGQIGAIESPGLLDVMLDHEDIPKAELKTVRRHRDPRFPDDPTKLHPWMGDYQAALYEGKADEAIKLLRAKDAITMYQSRQDAMTGMVERWAEMRRDHGIEAHDAIMIVYGSNADVDAVNRMAQERRIANDEVHGPGVRAVGRGYDLHTGDVVMLRRAAYQPSDPRQDRVENGTMGTVVKVDAGREQVWVRFDEPTGERIVMIDHAELRGRPEVPGEPHAALALAYAGHPFPMQGATFKYVGSLWGHWSQDKESTYSGDTRARFWLDVHVDGTGADTPAQQEARYRRLAEHLSRPTHRRASITWDERRGIRLAPRALQHRALPGRDREARYELLARRNVALERDALEPYLGLLGSARGSWLRELAESRRHLMRDMDRGWLEDELEAYEPAMANLRDIAAGARRSLRIEREYSAAYDRERAADRLARTLEAQATRHTGRKRDDLLSEAQALRTRAAAEHEEIVELQGQADELRRNGRHVDSWLRDHAEPAVRWLAVCHELAVRDEIERLRAADAQEVAPVEREAPDVGRDEPDTGRSVG